jgi:hypothetical protein
MNRKEDLMKHLSGEKTGLKTGLLKNSFIIFLLSFHSLSFCQIPVNGFCSLENYSLPKDYQAVVSADLNLDGNDELIFYSGSSKRLGIYSGITGQQAELKEFRLKSEISRLKQLRDKKGSQNLFAAVERKTRKVSVLHISADSLSEAIAEIAFDSYPENIFTGDINLNGTDEILVSGSGFDGLSILSRENGGIGERKMITETSYSEAIFIDMNDDGYPDILAFDILENALQFFFNNTMGRFSLERSILFTGNLRFLQSLDLNGNGFQDIVYYTGDRIEILFGDFQSSYEEKASIHLNDKITAMFFGDFNGDSLPDLAFIESKNNLKILFGKKDAGFHESITYLNKTSLDYFTGFRVQDKKNIASVSESGELLVISTPGKLKEEIKIVPSVKSGALRKFDYANDNIPDICFVDEYENSLQLLLNDKNGIPDVLYSIPLADDHKEIIADEFFKYIKTFYCYTEGAPLLEVLGIDFRTGKFSRKQLYAPGKILDIALQRVDSSLVNVFVVYNKNMKSYLGKFENRELSVTFKEYPHFDRHVSTARLLLKDEPEVYYWKSEADTFFFRLVEIKTGPNKYRTYFRIRKSDELKINLYGARRFYRGFPVIVSFTQNETDNYALVITGETFSISPKPFKSSPAGSKQFSNGYFGPSGPDGVFGFTVVKGDDSIHRLIYNANEKAYSLVKLLAAENVSDYFIARLDQKKYYLVYSDKKEGCLSISSLIK